MTELLKGRFGIQAGTANGNHAPSSAQEFSAERYHIDDNGRRVLAGLTTAETREFETLDALTPSDGSGDRVAWTFGGEPTTGREKRWLELYTKHDQALKKLKANGGR